MYKVPVRLHPVAVENALNYIDNKFGITWSLDQQVKEWKEQFNITLHRNPWNAQIGDEMEFESEEDATAWLLRFS